ncbi:non-ribosomal peptide synthetase [Cupriavidus basilensis]|uniref:non-ribosomal peptide synthetase n=1 Tax=Cupriavidus basilensis TaxID=68895 RepID=UPI000750D0D0|nr:non-ribosomal peptide synthetase [Cupriavidus basilensis]
MNAIVHDFSAAAQPLGREQRALEARATAPVTLAATLRGPLDVPRLRDALLRVAARHPSLGLAFGHAEGLRGLRQRFEGVPPRWAEAADAADAIAAPANPTAPLPALRATLLPLGPDHHQLLLAASPLAADGASLVTLYRELARAYAGEDANAAEDPQEAPLAYADYLEWTAGLAQDNAQAGHDYWHGIAGALAALDAPRLPWRRAAPDAAPAPAELNARIGSDEAAALQAWAQALGQPLPLALQAAWWLLLWRLDPADAFAAGWLHDCRRDFDALAGAVGRYEAVLPLAVRPDPDAPFAHWLAQLAAQAGSHLDWREHCPADAAAGAPGRIGFALATLPPAMPARGGPHWQAQPPQALPGFELALEIREDEHGAPRQFALHYDGARYRADAMSCLLDQYRTLLDTLRARPGTAIGALPLATAADAARAAAMHAAPLDAGTRMLPQRLAQWGRERPHQNALSAAGLQLDYRALNQRVDALAARLPALGLRRGAPVGLLLPRGGELVLALLAVLRAGGAYLPLDPSWPAPRRARILADAGATLVLAGARHLPGGADDTDGAADLPPHVDVAALLADSATAPADAGEPDIAAGQPAYVLYTSGSTGTPKGVVIEHGQLLNYAAAAGHALGLDRCERFALTSTVAADLGNTTLFGALWHGACLCVADDADTQDAAAFARFLARERPDCLKMVPSHLDALLGDSEDNSEHDNDGNGAGAPLPAGAAIVLGGESASPALLARLRRRAPAARLCNHYGPTETTVGILVHADDAADAADAEDAANDPGAGLPLTTVLANCEAHVLNAAGELAAAGETGELYLGGAQLCRGYLGRDSDAFVPHPRRAGERLYRSGDLARYLPRGGLELAGRADSQLKVRGFRIECGEIEHALLALPGVRQAAVVPMAGPDGATGETRLAAWLVPDDDSAVPLGGARRAALRAALAARLPEPMVPAHWIAVAELPRLPNGKVDRRALATRALPGDDAPTGAIAREPADALEALLLEQMRELLDAPALRVTDDLFEAGGHSLLVIKLVARIRKLLKLEIAPGAVFDAPSAAALATALRAASADPAQLETLAGLQRTLAAMSPEARAALRASVGAPAATAG